MLQLDVTASGDVLKRKAEEADKLFGKPVSVLMNNVRLPPISPL